MIEEIVPLAHPGIGHNQQPMPSEQTNTEAKKSEEEKTVVCGSSRFYGFGAF